MLRSTSRGRHCAVTFALLLSACSSDDDDKKTQSVTSDAGADARADSGAGACAADPALAADRDACKFTKGAMAEDTLGSCTGDAIPIEHIVVLMQENRSFDHYYGHLKGHGQDDIDVAPDDASNPGPDGKPITWFHQTKYCVEDTDHGWVAAHGQYDDGKMDGFATTNVSTKDPTGSRAMGYYDQSDIPFYYDLSSKFAISDRYFASLLGPTYPDRIFLMAGTAYGSVATSSDGLAPNGAPNVLKSLSEKGVSWKVYKTNLAGSLVFLDFASDPANADHFKDVTDFTEDAKNGTLPAVSFVDPNFVDHAYVETDEHPPANIQLGQQWVYDRVKSVTESPLWPKTALFIAYDEYGGLYDHVPPPPACVPDDIPPRANADLGGYDRLGFRVPLIVVSPYARRHFVSHVVHSHTSILRFIEAKHGLPAFTNRDANSDALFDMFDFQAPPDTSVPDFTEPVVDEAQQEACKKDFP